MKFNKWTIGLAALGVVSLAAAARAEEKMNVVQTAVSGTTISGYVDTSAQWNMGTGNAFTPPYAFGGVNKADGFNLNVVQLSIDKPLDESQWAAGYHVDLWFGPDADALGATSTGAANSDFAIRQAYVALRTPVGNGLDWKIGVFDTIIGYESLSSGNNPNYTHSYAFGFEPPTHTGVLATYRFSDMVSATVGIANDSGSVINSRAFNTGSSTTGGNYAESFKTYMASIGLTAPSNWGWLSGSTLSAGIINGYNSSTNMIPFSNVYRQLDNKAGVQTSYYVGTTLATPVTGWKVGAAFDYLNLANQPAPGSPNPAGGSYLGSDTVWAAGLYTTYQATEKLSFSLRGEHGDVDEESRNDEKVWDLTATTQYDLWKNVISRIEFRWDHAEHGDLFGGTPYTYSGTTITGGGPTRANAFMLAANIIYKF
jgi:hypothetical protein